MGGNSGFPDERASSALFIYYTGHLGIIPVHYSGIIMLIPWLLVPSYYTGLPLRYYYYAYRMIKQSRHLCRAFLLRLVAMLWFITGITIISRGHFYYAVLAPCRYHSYYAPVRVIIFIPRRALSRYYLHTPLSLAAQWCLYILSTAERIRHTIDDPLPRLGLPSFIHIILCMPCHAATI